MSWTDKNIIYNYRLFMYDHLGNPLGEMNGLEKGGSVTFSRYSETRKIASISTINDNYQKYAMIEIVVETNTGEREQLGRYCVDGQPKETEINGDIFRDYDLCSIIGKLKTHKVGIRRKWTGSNRLWTILGGANCDDGVVHFGAEDDVDKKEKYFGDDGFSVDFGDTAIDVLTRLCDEYDCYYYPVDRWVVICNYVNPAIKPAEFDFTMDNGTISGEVTVIHDDFTTINEAVCYYEDGDTVWSGKAAASADTGLEPFQREQWITEVWKLESINPRTPEEVWNQARRHLKLSMNPNNSFEFDGIYCGLEEGDVVNLTLSDGIHKCVIDEIEIELDAAMSTKYKLKEVTN